MYDVCGMTIERWTNGVLAALFNIVERENARAFKGFPNHLFKS